MTPFDPKSTAVQAQTWLAQANAELVTDQTALALATTAANNAAADLTAAQANAATAARTVTQTQATIAALNGEIAKAQAALAAMIATPNVTVTTPYAWQQDGSGWTIPFQAKTTYYVDPQAGDDSKAGTSEATPFRTLSKAMQKVGDADALLLKNGSTLPWFPAWLKKSYVRIGRYGAGPRPVIMVTGGNVGCHVHSNNTLWQGIVFKGDRSGRGLSLDGNGHRVEGCWLTGHFQAMNFSFGAGVAVCRSVLSRNYKLAGNAGHGQGAYADGAADLLFDTTAIIANGWDYTNPATATTEDHGLYLHCGTPPKFVNMNTRGCLVAGNGSNGVMDRNPGTHEHDLYLDNGLHGCGLVVGGPLSEVMNSVFTGAIDAPARSTPRGAALELDSMNGSAHDNLFINSRGAVGPCIVVNVVDYNKLPLATGALQILRNVARGWQGNFLEIAQPRASIELRDNVAGVTGWAVNYATPPGKLTASGNRYAPSATWRIKRQQTFGYTDWQKLTGEQATLDAPTDDYPASIEAYAQSIGLAASGEALLRACEANGPDNWDDRFTAASINAAMRAGH